MKWYDFASSPFFVVIVVRVVVVVFAAEYVFSGCMYFNSDPSAPSQSVRR